jgi:hypothetical protein
MNISFISNTFMNYSSSQTYDMEMAFDTNQLKTVYKCNYELIIRVNL